MSKELAEAVKLFISQPLNNPLTRGQIMEVARIALPILEQQERGEGEWIELGEGAIPVHPETVVEIKMRNGVTDGPRKAGGFFWFKGNAVRDEMECDIIAYRIIPERATNQNGDAS